MSERVLTQARLAPIHLIHAGPPDFVTVRASVLFPLQTSNARCHPAPHPTKHESRDTAMAKVGAFLGRLHLAKAGTRASTRSARPTARKIGTVLTGSTVWMEIVLRGPHALVIAARPTTNLVDARAAVSRTAGKAPAHLVAKPPTTACQAFATE